MWLRLEREHHWSIQKTDPATTNPTVVQRGPKAPQSQILVTFWAPFESPRGALLGSFWPKICKTEGLCRLFDALLPVSETGTKTGLPRGGGTCDPLTPAHVS